VATGDVALLRQASEAFGHDDIVTAVDALHPQVRWYGVNAETPEWTRPRPKPRRDISR